MTWQIWAVLSAVFAALTAILAKVGIQNINSDFATFVRTFVVLVALGLILLASRQYQDVAPVNLDQTLAEARQWASMGDVLLQLDIEIHRGTKFIRPIFIAVAIARTVRLLFTH